MTLNHTPIVKKIYILSDLLIYQMGLYSCKEFIRNRASIAWIGMKMFYFLLWILMVQNGKLSVLFRNGCGNTHLKLRSGDAQRTAILGIGGTSLIAIITWFFQRRDNESRWLSDGVFFGGAELRSKDARLSLTGLYILYNAKWTKLASMKWTYTN